MTLRALQLTLILTAAAAAIVMGGLLSTGARIACLGVLVAGTWLTEPERSRRGGGWWWFLALGSVLAVAGFAVAELHEPAETEAGIGAIAGSAVAIVGITIGFPTR
jgi:hypothetical protein